MVYAVYNCTSVPPLVNQPESQQIAFAGSVHKRKTQVFIQALTSWIPRMAKVLTKAMEGRLCHEFQTDLPAADLWGIYGSLLLGELVPQLLPQLLSKVELVAGDGGVGTVLLVTFPPAPGTSVSATHKEKFIKVDNENYIKEVEVIEGGFLNFGFLKYTVRLEIIGQDDDTSIIRSTIEYVVDEKHESNASLVSTSAFADIAVAITRYIKERRSLKQSPEGASG